MDGTTDGDSKGDTDGEVDGFVFGKCGGVSVGTDVGGNVREYVCDADGIGLGGFRRRISLTTRYSTTIAV